MSIELAWRVFNIRRDFSRQHTPDACVVSKVDASGQFCSRYHEDMTVSGWSHISANFITSSCLTEPNWTKRYTDTSSAITSGCRRVPSLSQKVQDSAGGCRNWWPHGMQWSEGWLMWSRILCSSLQRPGVRNRFILGFGNPPDRPPTLPQVADRTPMKNQNRVAARGWGAANRRIDESFFFKFAFGMDDA